MTLSDTSAIGMAPNHVKIQAPMPTRKLTARELKIFNRITAEFTHLTTSDAEQLTQYAEAVARYEAAVKQTKKHPNISVPIVNRSTGNVTGEKIIRNPAFVTVKEALSQLNSLARRLMIDAHSAEKRQKLLSKKLQAGAASEAKTAAEAAAKHGITEEQIDTEVERLRSLYIHATEEQLLHEALWYFTVFLPRINDPEGDEDIYVMPS